MSSRYWINSIIQSLMELLVTIKGSREVAKGRPRIVTSECMYQCIKALVEQSNMWSLSTQHRE